MSENDDRMIAQMKFDADHRLSIAKDLMVAAMQGGLYNQFFSISQSSIEKCEPSQLVDY